MNWRIVLAIAQKDLMDGIKNSYLLFGLLLPIGMSLVFRFAFGATSGSPALTLAVYDPARSQLVAALRALPQVKLLEVASNEQLPGEVEKNAAGGIAVPAGFDAAVKAGEAPELTAYVNRKRTAEVLAFRQLVQQQVWSLVSQEMPARITWTNVGAVPGSSALGELRLDRYLLIIFLSMSLVMVGAFTVPTLLVEEKEKRTLQALLISPARPADIVAGKALMGLTYSLLGAGVLIALNEGWAGDWYITLLTVLLGALFTVTTGLFLGGLFRTGQQVNTWSSLLMLLLILPGVGMVAAPIEPLMRWIPTYYVTHALGLSLAGDASLARVGGDLGILAASAIVAFAGVVWTLRREQS